MKHLLPVLAALTLALTALAGNASGAPPPAEYQDPTGDSGPGPDITKVTVSADDAGTLSFHVETPNRPTIGSEYSVIVYLDTDSNPATGLRGTDYALGMVGGFTALLRWNGTEPEPVRPSTATGSYSNGVATLSVNAIELGGASSFGFWVGVHDDVDDDSNWDAAPGSGTVAYSLVAPAAPAAPTQPAAPTAAAIERVVVPFTILRPRAGRVMSARGIQLGLDTGEIVRPESMQCTLKVAGKLVRPLAGGCKWRLPAGAKGKRGTLRFTATYQGVSVTQAYPIRVVTGR
jgi:hypothetical protein